MVNSVNDQTLALPRGKSPASDSQRDSGRAPPDATWFDHCLDRTVDGLDYAGVVIGFVPIPAVPVPFPPYVIPGPVIQAIPDVAAGTIRFARGDWRGGWASYGSAAPQAFDLVGNVAKVGRVAKWLDETMPWVSEALKHGSEACEEAAKVGKGMADKAKAGVSKWMPFGKNAAKASEEAAESAAAASRAASSANEKGSKVVPLFKDKESNVVPLRKDMPPPRSKKTTAADDAGDAAPKWAQGAMKTAQKLTHYGTLAGKNRANHAIGHGVTEQVDLWFPPEIGMEGRLRAREKAEYRQWEWYKKRTGVEADQKGGREGLEAAVEKQEKAQRALEGYIKYDEGAPATEAERDASDGTNTQAAAAPEDVEASARQRDIERREAELHRKLGIPANDEELKALQEKNARQEADLQRRMGF